MKPYALFILAVSIFLTAASHAAAQDFIVIHGIVKDSGERKPLAYAGITIAGTGVGTMSNADGLFAFNIPVRYEKDTLVISFIGFKPYKKIIADLSQGDELIVLLQAAVVILGDITVRAEPCDVECLISEVMKHYDDNYSLNPYLTEGFYRETRQRDGRYGYLIEAACRSYKTGYKSEHTTAIDKIRSSFLKEGLGLNTDENFLETLLKNDYVSNPYMGFYRRYKKKTKYVIEDTTMLDNVPVYVISAGSLPGWKQTYYINAGNYAIVLFEGESNYGFTGTDFTKPGKGEEFRYRHLKVINSFVFLDGKYFLSYLRMTLDGDNAAGNFMELDREFLANLINIKTPKALTNSEEMKSMSLENQLQEYDTVFWKHYNMLTRTPVQNKIVSDLEGGRTLEEQFQSKTSSSPGKKRAQDH